MNKFSIGGIFLLFLVFSIGVSVIPNVYAQTINAESVAFEETTIIEFTNKGTKDVSSFRMWLGSEASFQSFKTEKGWTGERTPQGVIVFTSPEPVKPGDSIKFGIKTDKISSGINWKALDRTQNEIDTGKSVAGEIQKPQPNPKSSTVASGEGVLSNSVFRIIPEKPNVNSNIRVTGENFGAVQEFDFFIDSKKVGSFVTNDAGYFMTTMKVPEKVESERVDFTVKDKKGNEKSISLRLGAATTKVPDTENVKLTVKGIADVIHRGDMLEITGTGQPKSAITAKIHNPSGEIINTRTAEIDSKGDWKLAEPIIVPVDAPFGRYTAEISDGREKITESWSVESSKVIIITPETLRFEPGNTMKFNGTALPNIPLELILEDPLGKERFSDIIQVDESGLIEFEYPTIANVDKEGTWTLIATQGKNKEFIYAGLGELPSIPVNFEFDKLNYKSSEKALITFSGKPSEALSMLIIDPSEKPKGDPISITLKPDGRGTYELDLKGYSSGGYTAVVSKGASKSTEVFTVGLQTGSGTIKINTTKLQYNPGDSILILGNTNPNVILTITLYSPDGKEVKVKETFSDKTGKISEDGFRFPSDAQPGKWQIKAVSGSNFSTVDLEVSAVQVEGMIISATHISDSTTKQKRVEIVVQGAKGSVEIDIVKSNGENIAKLSPPPATGAGKVIVPWNVPDGIEPGTYTFKAKDGYNSAETTLELS
ncbi:MAG: biofilm-associated protein [Nitrosarchaeum sp.]|nr:biofilm-associated protein [Nitrosarchaeum sp.]